MKNRILFILIIVLLFSFCVRNVFASELCSSKGYSIFTINGIFTNDKEARENKDNFKKLLKPTFNNQPLKIDYLYNPSHLLGAADLVDVLAQMIIDRNNDYDMVEMLNDASKKVTTQKFLLIGHSQGNFYANNLYDAVADKQGGVPSQSIGVYGVASPATRVAGGGKYITSSSDTVINSLAIKLFNNNILPSNINMPLQSITDGSNGHGFSETYLKYQGNRIVSDIKSSLDKLQNNDEQLSQDPCISTPEIDVTHKLQGIAFASADFVLNNAYKGGTYIANGAYSVGATIGSFFRNTALAVGKVVNGLFSNALDSIGDVASVTTLPSNIIEGNTEKTPPSVSSTEEQTPTTDNEVTETNTETENTEAMPPQVLGQETVNNTSQTSSSSSASHGNGSAKENNGNDNEEDDSSDNDTTLPVITVTGTNPIDVTKDTIYTDAGATALDDVDGVIAVVTTGNVDTSVLGTYTLTYTATDSGGNIDTKTRTVNVVDIFVPDSIPPVITITGNNPIDVTKGTTYADAGATAEDAVDGARTITSSGTVDMTTLGTYTITYTASDLSNNIATATRTVNVVSDVAAPVITLLGNSTEVVAKNTVYTDAGATALDIVDGTRDVVVTGLTDVDTSIVTTFIITYTATDISGNIATMTRTIIIDGGAKLDRPNFVTVSGNYAYVVSENSNSFEIIDISNPATLVHKSSLVHNHSTIEMYQPKSVAISGDYAYVVSYSNNLNVIDISNPLLPVIKSTLNNNDGGAILNCPNFITLSGNYAYIVSYGCGNGNAGNIEIVDISDPINPIHKSSYYGGLLVSPTSIAVSGNYAYVSFLNIGNAGGFLQILDISNPTVPTFKGAINDTDGGADISYPRSISVSGNHAYIASWDTKSLEIVDISNPNSPVHKAKLNSGFGNPVNFRPNSLFVSGNYVYLTSWTGETLEIVDISNPANPIHKGSLATGVGGGALSYPSSVFVLGDYAYVSSYMSNALEIVDISDPTFPIHKNKLLDGEFNHTDPVLSAEKQITTFNFAGLSPEVVGAVNETDHTVSLTVPFGTSVTALVPTITISGGASVVPNNGVAQNFTNSVIYTVTAENGSTQNYNVTVTIAPDPNPGPDNTPPTITSYTLNGTQSDITINPLTTPLVINLTSSENVDWVSVKIEKEIDDTFYKIYFSDSSNCVDGTDTCSKTWDGLLSSGGLLQNGTFRVKFHIKDGADNENIQNGNDEYLVSKIIVSGI